MIRHKEKKQQIFRDFFLLGVCLKKLNCLTYLLSSFYFYRLALIQSALSEIDINIKISMESEKPLDSIREMIKACVSTEQKSEKGKQLQKICHQILTQADSRKQIQFNVVVSSGSGKSPEPNQTFILQCLIWILIKFRSLKVLFSLRSATTGKAKNYGNVIELTLSNKNVKPINNSFFFLLDEIREQKYPREVKNFFQKLSIVCKIQGSQQKLKAKALNSKPQIYKFIGRVYHTIQTTFSDKNVYFKENTLTVFSSNAISSEENRDKSELERSRTALIHEFKKLYSLEWNLKGFDSQELKQFATIEQSTHEEYKIESNINKAVKEQYGFFKQFVGSSNQYLESINFVVDKHGDEIENISNFIASTPNLSILEVYYGSGVVITNVEPLLQSLIKNTPLIEKVYLAGASLQQSSLLSNSLLLKIYEECPFLVELQVGQKFEFSISETYQHTTPQEKIEKERVREAQIILESLALRNITLTHNYWMAKLLLKKKFNLLSVLQIVGSIEPICL